ncbi:MAG TPA: C4-type zinc ribbon domain-containing protein [Actinomycetales bacterium]|nr:C4-type zinc ribbon domain-containing protein [Actinomycetales bacterium]
MLDVQALDTRLAQIAHRRRSLPELAELTELESRASALRDELVGAQTRASDVQRELTKAEADVELVRQRAARDQSRLESGSGSHKELESLQHEIATLARRQSELEDTELEVMERLEAVTAEVERLTAEQADVQSRLDEVGGRRDAAWQQLDDEAARIASERSSTVAGIDAALLALYEKIRESAGGVGAAMLRARRCEGCRLELNPQELQTIRAAADDEVVRCEECRRILVRTGESGL